MDLKDIIAVRGSKGLFKLLKITRGGFLLEVLDESKKKIIKNISFSKATPLDNIAIYTKSKITALPIGEVLLSIHKHRDELKKIDTKIDNSQLLPFIETVIPNYDEDRLHISQIKKILTWYKILLEFQPDLFSKDIITKDTSKKIDEDDISSKEIEKQKIIKKDENVSERKQVTKPEDRVK